MADNNVGAPALDTTIESGQFDEKSRQTQQAPAEATPKKIAVDDDDEDEDIDALIEDLESQDGHDAFEEEEEDGSPGAGRVVPEEMLQTDSRVGLTESEVVARRRKYGLNQMKEEKENLILKFLSYFIGPIQFVMEVSLFFSSFCTRALLCGIYFERPTTSITHCSQRLYGFDSCSCKLQKQKAGEFTALCRILTMLAHPIDLPQNSSRADNHHPLRLIRCRLVTESWTQSWGSVFFFPLSITWQPTQTSQ